MWFLNIQSDRLSLPAVLASLECSYKEFGRKILIPFEFIQKQAIKNYVQVLASRIFSILKLQKVMNIFKTNSLDEFFCLICMASR